MPYIKEECIAGNTIDYRYYYAPRWDMKGGSRRRAENRTSDAQKKVNHRSRCLKLTRILNANFGGNDYYITFSYRADARPDKERLRKDIRNLLDFFRREYRKAGKDFKYVWVAEVGERGAVHIHMVINNIDSAVIKRSWNKGWITIKPLDDNGQYNRLASYFIKYSEKTMKTEDELQGRTYNASKNLFIPEPDRKKIKSKNAYNHTVEVPAGYYIDKDSIVETWHEVTGYMYFAYTLIFDGKRRRNSEYGKHSYNLDLDTGEVEIIENRRESDRIEPLKAKRPAKRKNAKESRRNRKKTSICKGIAQPRKEH